jgi:hypothetical protein
MFSQIKAISEESLIDKLIELNISKSEDKSLADLISELDDTYLLETLFKAQWSIIENFIWEIQLFMDAKIKIIETSFNNKIQSKSRT